MTRIIKLIKKGETLPDGFKRINGRFIKKGETIPEGATVLKGRFVKKPKAITEKDKQQEALQRKLRREVTGRTKFV